MAGMDGPALTVDAERLGFKELNEALRRAGGNIVINNCSGHRYIAAGMFGKRIEINGTPGNALGAYLDGAEIIVNGNAQDATGDTMNDGMIVVRGSAGDALGYSMRGGKIYVRGNSGYRTGIHMKQYEDKKPVVVVGGKTGDFLGEYQAGGLIIALSLDDGNFVPGSFTGAGIHGGKIFARSTRKPENLPKQVTVLAAEAEDLKEIEPYLREYASIFSLDYDKIMEVGFYVLRPNAANPYQSMYTAN